MQPIQAVFDPPTETGCHLPAEGPRPMSSRTGRQGRKSTRETGPMAYCARQWETSDAARSPTRPQQLHDGASKPCPPDPACSVAAR
jgi:hypothetical protein